MLCKLTIFMIRNHNNAKNLTGLMDEIDDIIVPTKLGYADITYMKTVYKYLKFSYFLSINKTNPFCPQQYL